MFEDILDGWEDLLEKHPEESANPFYDEYMEEQDEWDTGMDWHAGDTDTIWNTQKSIFATSLTAVGSAVSYA